MKARNTPPEIDYEVLFKMETIKNLRFILQVAENLMNDKETDEDIIKSLEPTRSDLLKQIHKLQLEIWNYD